MKNNNKKIMKSLSLILVACVLMALPIGAERRMKTVEASAEIASVLSDVDCRSAILVERRWRISGRCTHVIEDDGYRTTRRYDGKSVILIKFKKKILRFVS